MQQQHGVASGHECSVHCRQVLRNEAKRAEKLTEDENKICVVCMERTKEEQIAHLNFCICISSSKSLFRWCLLRVVTCAFVRSAAALSHAARCAAQTRGR